RLDALLAAGGRAAVPVQAQAQAPRRTAQEPVAASRSTGEGGPGSFEVDEDSAERALERTLTQAGALLLPPGAFTLTPGFAYVRNESRRPELVQLTDPASGTSGIVLVDPELRRNEFALRLGFKAGLPWDAQLEIDLPYQYVRASRRSPLSPVESGSGSGFGDA